MLRLKKNIQFHNGRNATAKDLEFSLLRWFYTAKKTYERSNLVSIVGSENIVPGSKYRSGEVSGIQILDEFTLVVRLKNFHPSFMFALNSPCLSLVPIEELKEDLISWKSIPIGAGPYKVKGISKEGRVSLEKKLSSSDGPKFVDITSNISDSDVDIFTVSPGHIERGYEPIYIPNEYDMVQTMIFNYESKAANNINFRRAIFFGVDRLKNTQNRFHVTPVTQLVSPMFPGYRKIDIKNYRSRALEEVKKIPKEILEKTYQLPIFDTNPDDKSIQLIVESLNSIGLKFIAENSADKRGESIGKEVPVRITSFGQGIIVDPTFIFSLFTESSPLAGVHPKKNDEYEKLYSEAIQSPSTDILAKKIHELSNFIEDTALVVPFLAHAPTFFVKKNSSVSGLSEQRSAIAFDIRKLKVGK